MQDHLRLEHKIRKHIARKRHLTQREASEGRKRLAETSGNAQAALAGTAAETSAGTDAGTPLGSAVAGLAPNHAPNTVGKIQEGLDKKVNMKDLVALRALQFKDFVAGSQKEPDYQINLRAVAERREKAVRRNAAEEVE